jgi:hypothetical protein
MEAKELRIGNLIWFNDAPTLKGHCAVSDVSDEIIRTTGGDAYIDECEPITLTEEWAIKFGFECLLEMAMDISQCSKYDITITTNDLSKMFVHDLQNLYFALTNEELTIK